jgi:thiol-disulfide isomerase/thioredoxin
LKKILLLLVSLVLLGLVACNQTTTDTKQDSIPRPEENIPKEEVSQEDNLTEETDLEEETTQPVTEPSLDENPPILKGQLKDVRLAAKAKIPNYQWTTLDEQTIELSQYEGKIVLINFWATWCHYCDMEMPDLDLINSREDVVVLAINSQEKQSKVEDYLKKGGFKFPVILDEDGTYTRHFSVTVFPTTLFIDEDGILIGVANFLSLEEAESIIQNIKDNVYD